VAEHELTIAFTPRQLALIGLVLFVVALVWRRRRT
jgi:hypothetical protein